MKKISQELDDKLLRYLDGELDALEKKRMELSLGQDEALRQRFAQFQAMELSLKANAKEVPSKNFTQVVMQKLDQYPSQTTRFSMLNGILLLAGVLLMTGIATVLVSSGVFDHATTTFDLNKIEFPKQYIQRTLPSIPFDGKLLMNVIILFNLGLSWLVFDRAILKPYFRRRMQMGH